MPILSIRDTSTDGGNAYAFDAFIAYRRETDLEVATAIQSALYQITSRLQPLNVFLDKTDLAVSPELWGSIQESLNKSEFFILLASPQSAESVWVQREVDERVRTRSAEKFLIVLTEGEIVWNPIAKDFDWDKTTALPRSLQGVFKAEPLYLDLRWTRTGGKLTLRDTQFKMQMAELTARLQNREVKQVLDEELRPVKSRIALGVAAALAILLIPIALIGINSYGNFLSNRRKANEGTAVARLRTIVEGQGIYSATTLGEGSFATFEQLIDAGLIRAPEDRRDGYYKFDVRVTQSGGRPGFDATAEPITAHGMSRNGDHSFYTNELGIVYRVEGGKAGSRANPGKPVESY